jgi:hypothetical protein
VPIADFLGPYLVTIAGVVTTGVAAFLLRYAWQWATAPEPTVIQLELMQDGFKLHNRGDFTVWVIRVDGLPPSPQPWRYVLPRRWRLPPNQEVSVRGTAGEFPAIRVDHGYRVLVRATHGASWELNYAADPALSQGSSPSSVRRLWPKWWRFVREVVRQRRDP